MDDQVQVDRLLPVHIRIANWELSSVEFSCDFFEIRTEFLQFFVCAKLAERKAHISQKTHYPTDTKRLIAFQYEDLCSLI